MDRFGQSVAIVTGAASGIGREIALVLARQGARVLAVDRNGDGLREVCAQAQGTMTPCVTELTRADAPASVFAACTAAFGAPLSILVNNAGLGNARAAHETSDEVFDRYLDLNLRITFRMSRDALAAFGPDGGAIVNIASIFGLVGFPRSAPYAAAKAALGGLTRQMAADYGARGVRVNAIAPGLIATPATAERIASNTLFQEGLIRATPLGRPGTPKDVADAVAFLCSGEAAFISGQTLAVDGGWSTTHYVPQA